MYKETTLKKQYTFLLYPDEEQKKMLDVLTGKGHPFRTVAEQVRIGKGTITIPGLGKVKSNASLYIRGYIKQAVVYHNGGKTFSKKDNKAYSFNYSKKKIKVKPKYTKVPASSYYIVLNTSSDPSF